MAGGEIWSVGGIDPTFTSDGRTFYRSTSGEGCALGGVDVPWLSEDPVSGILEPEESVDVTVTWTPRFPRSTSRAPYRPNSYQRGHPPDRPARPGDDERHPTGRLGQGDRHRHRVVACDQPGWPLAGATVQIGDFVVETDGDGSTSGGWTGTFRSR